MPNNFFNGPGHIRALKQEINDLKGENDKLRSALESMRFAYINKDPDMPHDFEDEAMKQANALLGKWLADWEPQREK